MPANGGGLYDTLGCGTLQFLEDGREGFADLAEVESVEFTPAVEVEKRYSMRTGNIVQRSASNKQRNVAGKATLGSPIGEVLKFYFQSKSVDDLSQEAGSIDQTLKILTNGWVNMDENSDLLTGRAYPSNVVIKQSTAAGGGATAFTADDSTDVLTITGHNYKDGDKFQVSTAGTLPAGLAADTDYFVISATANTIQVSATKGGAAIDITDTGTGVHKLELYYVDNEDYEYKKIRAMVFADPTKRIANEEVVDITADFAAAKMESIDWFTQPDFKGLMLFTGDPAAGVKQEWIAYVQIRPAAAFATIAESGQTFDLEFDILDHPVYGNGKYIDRSGDSYKAVT